MHKNQDSDYNKSKPTMASNVGPENIVTNGLVLYLDAANHKSYVSGSTTWRDISGRGNNGTLSGSAPLATFDSNNGGSLVFDGSNDYVSTPLNVDSNPVSLCAWFYPTTITSLNGHGIMLTDNGGWDKGFEINNSQWFIHTGAGFTAISSPTPSANTWYNGVLVYTTISMEFYINGTSIWTGGTPGGSAGSNLELGRANFNNGNGSRFYVGRIASAMVYNRALSATEILQNYNELKSRFGL